MKEGAMPHHQQDGVVTSSYRSADFQPTAGEAMELLNAAEKVEVIGKLGAPLIGYDFAH